MSAYAVIFELRRTAKTIPTTKPLAANHKQVQPAIAIKIARQDDLPDTSHTAIANKATPLR